MRSPILAIALSVVASGALAHGEHDTGSHHHSHSSRGGLIPSAAAAQLSARYISGRQLPEM